MKAIYLNCESRSNEFQALIGKCTVHNSNGTEICIEFCQSSANPFDCQKCDFEKANDRRDSVKSANKNPVGEKTSEKNSLNSRINLNKLARS